jgi:hypothetical protein
MLTGVWDGHFYVVAAGISFYIRVVGFCFGCLRSIAFKVICCWCFCFYYCFTVEGDSVTACVLCGFRPKHTINCVNIYVRLSRIRRMASEKHAW